MTSSPDPYEIWGCGMREAEYDGGFGVYLVSIVRCLYNGGISLLLAVGVCYMGRVRVRHRRRHRH